jgi:cytoskeleton protein RodZ
LITSKKDKVMNDNKHSDDSNAQSALAVPSDETLVTPLLPTPGWELLRAAREDSGMPLEGLAAVLKVPVRKLEALEAGELNQGADLTFSRALAASVCRHLRIDPIPILAAWPKLHVGNPKSLPSINDGAPGAATALPPAKREGAGVLWAIVVLVIAGIGLWLAIEQTQTSASKRAAAQGSRNVLAQPVIRSLGDGVAAADPSGVVDADVQAQSVAAAVADVANNLDSAPVSNAVGAAAGSQVSDAAAAALKATQARVVQQSTNPLNISEIAKHLLVIQASSESWVEVANTQGDPVFTNSLAAGDYVVLDQPSEMSVVIGNAAGIVVHSRGTLVDVAGNAKGNVARFDIR